MKIILIVELLYLSLTLASCGTSRRYTPDALPEGSEYYFSIFGDSRDGNDIYALLQRRALVTGKPLATVHLGDMISNSQSPEQWPSFIKLTETYVDFRNFYPVIGNHDVADFASQELFLAAFPQVPRPGYWSAQIGECFCIFLNSEDLEVIPGIIGPTQLAWLQVELASDTLSSTHCRLVFMHRPPFPQNHHKDEPLQPTSMLHQLFQAYRISAVIASHEHSYSRMEKDGILYLITGGAGSPLYAPAGPDSAFFHYVQASYLKSKMRFRIIDFAGHIRDDFEILIPSSDGD